MKTIAQQLNVKEFPFEIKDKNGNRIYFEDSNGDWYKKEYDSNGKEVYFENCKGNWSKSEFDSDGNEIYYENSDGEIIDNRPRPKSYEGNVVEIDGKKYKLTEV